MEDLGAYAEQEGVTDQQLKNYMNLDKAVNAKFCQEEGEICQKLNDWVDEKYEG